MADIATTADMSAGLIYRYFDSKRAIVKAIIEQQCDAEGSRVIDQINSPQDLSKLILDMFECWQCGEDPKMNAALFLELTAECTRDPEIARAVRDKDQRVAQGLGQAVQRIAHARGVNLSSAALRHRVLLLHCLVEGLAARAVRDPKLQRSSLKPAIEAIVTVLVGDDT